MSASPSGSLAATGSPTAPPAGASSATVRVAVAEANAGAPLAASSSSMATAREEGATRSTPLGSCPSPRVTVASSLSASCSAARSNRCRLSPSAKVTRLLAAPSSRNDPAPPLVVSGTVTSRSAALSRLSVTCSDAPSVTLALACPNDTRRSLIACTSAGFDQRPMPTEFSARTRTCVAAAAIEASVAQAPMPQPEYGCVVQSEPCVL